MQHGACLPKEIDPNQPLSPVGRDQIIKSAKAARSLGLQFELVVASRKTRSIQTAEFMAEYTNYPLSRIEISDAVKAMAPTEETIGYIAEYDGLDAILICGHLPSLGLLASTLLSPKKQVEIAVENGGMMQIDYDLKEGKGVLKWSLTPAQLGLIGRD